jgi:hypothetical protein
MTLNDYDFLLIAVPRGSTDPLDAVGKQPFRLSVDGYDTHQLHDAAGAAFTKLLRHMEVPLESD